MKTKTISLFLLALIALASIACSIVCFTLDTGTMYGGTESRNTYGADFYTDVQNAAAQAATNTYYIGECIEDLASCLATIFGLVFAVTAIIFIYLTVEKVFEMMELSKAANAEVVDQELPEL